MKATSTVQKFVIHWGEMSSFWGINRSVAQIYGLLYVSGKPLPADEIAKKLSIARSNVSSGLKELQAWGIVRIAHFQDDKRDHFEALADVWEAFGRILVERKRREVDPTLRVLRDCLGKAGPSKKLSPDEAVAKQRLAAMLEFFEITSSLADRAAALPPKAFKRLAQTGNTIFQVAGVG